MSMQAGGTRKDDDEFLLFILGTGAAAAILGSAAAFWTTVTTWLVRHEVMVAAGQRPVIRIPGSGGAGLDVPRAAILAGLSMAAIAWSASVVRHRLAARRADG